MCSASVPVEARFRSNSSRPHTFLHDKARELFPGHIEEPELQQEPWEPSTWRTRTAHAHQSKAPWLTSDLRCASEHASAWVDLVGVHILLHCHPDCLVETGEQVLQ
jgi:hypothetical protein